MKVELASSCGFCFGVKRAIKMAEDAKNASSIGELIHNQEEINRLKNDYNVKTLQDISQVGDEKKLIIRTHGIVKQDLIKLQNENKEIIDATCPFVKKPQKIVEKMSDEGYDIIIFGDENHPEIKGIKSYASGKVFVVLKEEELKNLKLSSRVAVVSQTTKKVDNFTKIVNELVKKVKEVRVFNTICDATSKNQEAARELSKRADVMVVVGGKNSSNTKQLFLICKEFCANSYLIENEKELKKEWFLNKDLCGITAGASTPDWIIQKIIKQIQAF